MNELDEKIARGDAGLKIAEERAARRRQLAGLVAEEQRAADVEHQTDLIMTDLEKRTANVKENIAKNEADRAALSQAEADLLNTEAFTNASAVGDNGTALKEASLGRKYGLDFYCDQNVQKTTAETANYTPSIAFHKNAFALVTRQLEMPLGAPQGVLHLLRRLRPARRAGLRPEDQDRHRLHRHALRRQDPQPRARRRHHR